MTAGVLDRLTAAMDTARPAAAFFAALDQADQRIAEREDLQWRASFAPPVRSFSTCSCGATYECRGSEIQLTDAERDAATRDIAAMYGDSQPGRHVFALVKLVVDAVNRVRADDDNQAMRDFDDAHAYCGDDL